MRLNFIQIKIDPCLYYTEYSICTIYVDDTIFWCHDESKTDKTISEFKFLDVDSTDAGDVDLFLGVLIDTEDDVNISMSNLV